MKCPLKEDNFGRMPDCQPDCAWMVNGVCAVAARYYDVDANDDLPPENDISAESVGANDANDALDSREKLKGDAYHLMCDTWNKGLVFAKRPYEDIPLDAVMWKFGDMLALLDRQAAITEREIEKKWSCFSDSAGGHITELTNQLESAHAKNRALKAHIAKMQEGRHGWHIKGKELQKEADMLKKQLETAQDVNERQDLEYVSLSREIGTLRAERDRYRELCGKLLDAADEMRRVRDAFDQFERGEA